MSKTFVGLAMSLNMIEDLRNNTFSQEEEINEEEFKLWVEWALNPKLEDVENCAGHDKNKWGLPQAFDIDEEGQKVRKTVKMGLGDELIWAQFVGKRRNEDGTPVDDDEEFLFFRTEVIQR